jgi:4-hydroxy-tetrahydrodipicolinate synthase
MDINNYSVWTALITPLNEDKSVDFESLKKMLLEQDRAGNGILILGSTGEALNLAYKEMVDILNAASKVNLNVPIMVGVGGYNIDYAKRWIELLNNYPVHAYLLVTPLYAKPGENGQYNWFKTLLDASTKPAMLYNIPSRAGVSLNHHTVRRLKDHKNFWAIKEASGNIEECRQYMDDNPDALIFSGDDGLTPELIEIGAKGVVSVASNVWPNETKQIVEKSLRGEMDSNIKAMWEKCSDSLFDASNPVPVKHLLHIKEKIKTPFLKFPLSEDDLKDHKNLKEADLLISKWNGDK